MKKLIILGAVIVFFMFGASDVSACSCLLSNERSTAKKIKTAYRQATAVFSGEVTEISRRSQTLIVKFKVSIYWKGQLSRETIVQTAENSAMCGYNFEIGKKYLVYVSGKDGEFQTNICTRTAAGNADKKYLDKIKKPIAVLRETKPLN